MGVCISRFACFAPVSPLFRPCFAPVSGLLYHYTDTHIREAKDGFRAAPRVLRGEKNARRSRGEAGKGRRVSFVHTGVGTSECRWWQRVVRRRRVEAQRRARHSLRTGKPCGTACVFGTGGALGSLFRPVLFPGRAANSPRSQPEPVPQNDLNRVRSIPTPGALIARRASHVLCIVRAQPICGRRHVSRNCPYCPTLLRGESHTGRICASQSEGSCKLGVGGLRRRVRKSVTRLLATQVLHYIYACARFPVRSGEWWTPL